MLHYTWPLYVPAWITRNGHQPLCPVAAFRAYVTQSASYEGDDLWEDPMSSTALTSPKVASFLVRLISIADPDSHPKAHQIRKYASSLAFFRSFDVEQVRRAGQWSSSASFVQRYLQHHLTDVAVVAMGSAPND